MGLRLTVRMHQYSYIAYTFGELLYLINIPNNIFVVLKARFCCSTWLFALLVKMLMCYACISYFGYFSWISESKMRHNEHMLCY